MLLTPLVVRSAPRVTPISVVVAVMVAVMVAVPALGFVELLRHLHAFYTQFEEPLLITVECKSNKDPIT